MLAENTTANLKVAAQINALPEPHFTLPTAGSQKSGAPMIQGAMELRAAMQLNIHPSLREFGSCVHFCFRDGCMVMAGVLPSYFLKQLAQEAVRNLEGVNSIDNRIYVESTYDEDPNSNRARTPGRILPR